MSIKFLIAFIFTTVFIVLLGLYLGPDDLSHCDKIPSNVKACEASDAIVAVSGGDTVARTNEAISLYKFGWGKKLVFSGAAADKSGPSNAKAMKKLAEEAGIDSNDIIIEEYSENTRENAKNTINIFNKYNIKSVILVTSSYHQRRAGLEFQQRSSDVKIRNHPVASDNQWSNLWWLTPTGWYLAITESVKIVNFYLISK